MALPNSPTILVTVNGAFAVKTEKAGFAKGGAPCYSHCPYAQAEDGKAGKAGVRKLWSTFFVF
jgi:hypothetical protein